MFYIVQKQIIRTSKQPQRINRQINQIEIQKVQTKSKYLSSPFQLIFFIKMWNPFNYISSSQTQLPQSSQQPSPQKQTQQKNTHLHRKYLIQQHFNIQKRIKQFQQMIMAPSHHQQQTHKLIKVFPSLIQSLQHFMADITQLKQQYELNLAKIENYDSCLRKIEKHNTIVDNIIEQHQKQRDGVMELLRQKDATYQASLTQFNQEILHKDQLILTLTSKITDYEQRIDQLNHQNTQLNHKLQLIQSQNHQLSSKLSLLIGHNTSKPQSSTITSQQYITQCKQYLQQPQSCTSINPRANNLPLLTLTFSQTNITSKIISYLSITDIHSLSLTNKHIHSIITHSLPKTLYHRLNTQKLAQLQQIKNQSIYFNRTLLDQSDGQNLKISAIKYLFFNHKPGTYILSMFQQDITKINQQECFTYLDEEQQSIKNSILSADMTQSSFIGDEKSPIDKSKKSWRDYFKSEKNHKPQENASKCIKNQSLSTTSNKSVSSSITQLQRIKKFSLAELKNSQTFNKVQQQISKSFHHHVFSLKLPKDLQTFGKLMVQQFAQLKKELSSHTSQKPSMKQWTSKLLTLSKFLYLESQQLWTLGQNIFGKVIKCSKQNSQLKSQLQDLQQSQRGLRRLVDQLAKNKLQMQKRIWQYQRKNGFLKLSTQNIQKVNQRLQKQIQLLRSVDENKQVRIQKLQKDILGYKDKLLSTNKKYKDKMQEFSFLKEQISNIQWL